jgi:hypothetical protein
LAKFGGPQPGSGRKPKLLTALLLEQPKAEEDIRFAYELFSKTMRDEGHPIELRLDCARELFNRLCGKPAQSVNLGGDGTAITVVRQARDSTAGKGKPEGSSPE